MSIVWSDALDFRYESDIGVRFAGYIDKRTMCMITPELISNAKAFLRTFGEDPAREKEILKKEVAETDLANFIFLRSMFDYGNIAPSDTYAGVMLRIYKEHGFLFRPLHPLWDELLALPPQRIRKVLVISLLRLRGLMRLSFVNMATHWANAIQFLREVCNGNAGNMFEKLAPKLGIDPDDRDALEKLQLLLERKDVKKRLGINFPYGKKNGRLLIALMAGSERGFDVLLGARRNHLENFNMPIDSEVVRVSLNSGLIRITEVAPDNLAFGGKGGRGVAVAREEFTEVCQKAWKLVAARLNILPVDLDFCIWSIGRLYCKQFGALCYICPSRMTCDSWRRGSVREADAGDWNRGCFSFARPEPGINRLILRTCQLCPDYTLGPDMKKRCVRDRRYYVQKEDEEFLTRIFKIQ